MTKKKALPVFRPERLEVDPGLDFVRSVIRTQPQPEGELETLRQIAECARVFLESFERHEEALDVREAERQAARGSATAWPEAPRASTPQRIMVARARLAAAASATDIALHGWEWWTFPEGKRGPSKRAVP